MSLVKLLDHIYCTLAVVAAVIVAVTIVIMAEAVRMIVVLVVLVTLSNLVLYIILDKYCILYHMRLILRILLLNFCRRINSR